jgi:hypothetical protein
MQAHMMWPATHSEDACFLRANLRACWCKTYAIRTPRVVSTVNTMKYLDSSVDRIRAIACSAPRAYGCAVRQTMSILMARRLRFGDEESQTTSCRLDGRLQPRKPTQDTPNAAQVRFP